VQCLHEPYNFPSISLVFHLFFPIVGLFQPPVSFYGREFPSVCVRVRLYLERGLSVVFLRFIGYNFIYRFCPCVHLLQIWMYCFKNYSINNFRNYFYLFVTYPPECRNVLKQIYRVYLDNTATLPGRVGGFKIYSRNLIRVVRVASSLRYRRKNRRCSWQLYLRRSPCP
jgi:hypothetical protein